MATVTGNCLILKPSERDPGAAMIIAELCERAGLPPGVLNVVHGSVPTVNAICDHQAIKAISFVGGDRAGHHIYERSGSFPLIDGLLLNIVQGDEERQTSTGSVV
jgi:malonate-semialdehyde dehydrogenase (acetylating) / methylmalonate-semialdehyde dehydrogenase